MSTAEPAHGLRKTYLAGCKCEPCTLANARYCKEWRWRARNGHVTVDATKVREHIKSLPMSATALEAITGIPRGTVRHIMLGQAQRTSVHAAQALLAVTPDAAIGAHHMSAIGARRRLQALAVRGWSGDFLAVKTGYSRANLYRVRAGKRDMITGDVDQRIRAVYEELQDLTPAPVTRIERGAVTRTLTEASSRGWLPPAAWDDIDDPNEVPSATTQSSRRPQKTLVAEYEFLLSCGESSEQACEQLGVTWNAVEMAMLRVGKQSVVEAKDGEAA